MQTKFILTLNATFTCKNRKTLDQLITRLSSELMYKNTKVQTKHFYLDGNLS